MHDEFDRHHREYLARKRRMRRLMRRLPRRAAVMRAKLPDWLKRLAEKSWFIWSFERGPVKRAIYFGSILALLPLFGIQFPLSVLLALGLRANLPITLALQFITNPFTIVPVYGFTYLVGFTVLDALVGKEAGFDPEAVSSAVQAGDLAGAGHAVLSLTVGGVLVGLAVALAIDFGWRLLRWEAAVFKRKFDALRAARAAHLAEREVARSPGAAPSTHDGVTPSGSSRREADG
jgi:uncharacterized protein (DUF2062 family)